MGLRRFGQQVLARPNQGVSWAETQCELLKKKLNRGRKFWGPWGAVCKIQSPLMRWKLQEAAQAFSARPPGHFLLVQYISTLF